MKPITPHKLKGFWYLIRRVPRRFAAFDQRGLVRMTTHIRIADDPNAVTAASIAAQLNRDLEESWRALAKGEKPRAKKRYDDAVLDARGLGFGYFPTTELMARSIEELVKRVEVLIARRSGDVPEEVSALLGGEDRPVIRTGELLTEYEQVSRVILSKMSPDQVRKWRNQRKRAVANLLAVIGDKPLHQITREDALKFQNWWKDRLVDDGLEIGSANKDIATIARMFTKVGEAKNLNLTPVFAKLRIEGEEDGKRPPFEVEFIRTRILSPGMFADINEEARRVLYVMVETGLRPSEIVNLTAKTIHLGHNVPHVEIKPIGRVLKTTESARKMPLVGVSLEAMRLQPKGFPRYFDSSSALSAVVNKALEARGLKPTEEHTLYSLRHSFEDRLTALKTMPDKIHAYLMGHAYSRPKYGSEPQLDHLAEWLNKMAFRDFPTAL